MSASMGDVIALRKRQFRRPEPPSDLLFGFEPSQSLGDWARAVFIDSDGPLHNPEHEHLESATIGFAWAAEENIKGNRRVLGLTELMPPMAMGKWQRGRAIQIMRDWFGDVPDFLITIDVVAASFDDASFCALVEHELYHCAQAKDAMGYPKFSRDTGEPVWGVRGHDVEEFVGVVARYGTEATSTTELVKAGSRKALVGVADISFACGVCAERRRA
jgi:hypothetical protein